MSLIIISVVFALYIADKLLKNNGLEPIPYYICYGIGFVIGFIEHLFA